MKKLLARFGVKVLAQLGIELGHDLHPGVVVYAAAHPVTVIAGRINARRFICSNPGEKQ